MDIRCVGSVYSHSGCREYHVSNECVDVPSLVFLCSALIPYDASYFLCSDRFGQVHTHSNCSSLRRFVHVFSHGSPIPVQSGSTFVHPITCSRRAQPEPNPHICSQRSYRRVEEFRPAFKSSFSEDPRSICQCFSLLGFARPIIFQKYPCRQFVIRSARD